jgi:hypothetical protein
MDTHTDPATPLAGLTPIERLRIVTLVEAARLSGVSKDTLLRHHRDKLVRLSPRRLGIRVGDALMLAEKSA